MMNPDKSGITSETFASMRGQPVAPTGASITDKLYNQLKGAFTDSKGNVNWAGLATAAAGVKAITGADKVQTPGYKGSIPMDLQAIRGKVNYQDPNRRPGSMGRQYFTDTAFASPANVAAARTAVGEQASGILSGYRPTPAPAATAPTQAMETLPPSGVSSLMPVPQAQGMAKGGVARYLQGATDGMADKIPSSIDGKQKAALSHGEFVIPARIVSELGNGSTEAGARKLYAMMERVQASRKKSIGKKKVAVNSKSDKHLPA
jgi:hypothetical protein